MKVYLAAPYERRAEMHGYAKELEALGETVTSTWVDGHHEVRKRADGTYSGEDFAYFAREDCKDLLAADALIAFTSAEKSRGGYRVEEGMALACALIQASHRLNFGPATISLIGERGCVFDYLDSYDEGFYFIRHYKDWAQYKEETFGRQVQGESSQGDSVSARG